MQLFVHRYFSKLDTFVKIFIMKFWSKHNVMCYGSKFLPSAIFVLLCFSGTLASYCEQFCNVSNCTCTLFYIEPVEHAWREENWTLENARLLVTFIIVVHFIFISSGFVYRDHMLHKRPPLKNRLWLTTVILLIILQCIYTMATYLISRNGNTKDYTFQMPIWVLVIAAISPILVLTISEMVKHEEIKVNKRYRKRVRLDFGTKLGMNSPF